MFCTCQGVVAVSLMGVMGCAPSAVKHAEQEPLPATCQQIVDHVNAYIVYMGCVQPSGQVGWAPGIGLRDPVDDSCSIQNEVTLLPYRSRRVDDVVYETIRENFHRGLMLERCVTALWMTSPSLLEQSDDEPEAAQALLRERFWQATAVSNQLLAEISSRLGQQRACNSVAMGAPVPESTISAALEAMQLGVQKKNGDTWYGLFALSQKGSPSIDPNLAVAIAFAQKAGFSDVPSHQDVVSMLQELSVATVP